LLARAKRLVRHCLETDELSNLEAVHVFEGVELGNSQLDEGVAGEGLGGAVGMEVEEGVVGWDGGV